MSRLKKSSEKISLARKRLSGLHSIDPNLDLGNGLTLDAYRMEVEETEGMLSQYNELLAQVDVLQNQFLEKEKKLNDMSQRVFNGVASKYGKDSNEYEAAGGKKVSERKHPVKKAKIA